MSQNFKGMNCSWVLLSDMIFTSSQQHPSFLKFMRCIQILLGTQYYFLDREFKSMESRDGLHAFCCSDVSVIVRLHMRWQQPNIIQTTLDHHHDWDRERRYKVVRKRTTYLSKNRAEINRCYFKLFVMNIVLLVVTSIE